jgi:hypothetical protein
MYSKNNVKFYYIRAVVCRTMVSNQNERKKKPFAMKITKKKTEKRENYIPLQHSTGGVLYDKLWKVFYFLFAKVLS